MARNQGFEQVEICDDDGAEQRPQVRIVQMRGIRRQCCEAASVTRIVAVVSRNVVSDERLERIAAFGAETLADIGGRQVEGSSSAQASFPNGASNCD